MPKYRLILTKTAQYYRRESRAEAVEQARDLFELNQSQAKELSEYGQLPILEGVLSIKEERDAKPAVKPEPLTIPVSRPEMESAKRHRLWANYKEMADNLIHDIEAGLLPGDDLAAILVGMVNGVNNGR